MNFQTAPDDLLLMSGWTVSRVTGEERFGMTFPGDIHSSLLTEGVIDDPYWRDRETSLDWVHESDWLAECSFNLPKHGNQRHVLTLSDVDCHAIVRLNDIEVGRLGNRFKRYDLDVTKALRSGKNRLEILFQSNSEVAQAKADALPFSVPYIKWNNRIPHYNLLRKPQCDAGWDWNIALSPIGIYGDIRLRRVDPVRLDDVTIRQHHGEDGVMVEAVVTCDAAEATETFATLSLDGQTVETKVELYPGQNSVPLSILVSNPRLWWPAGHGAQELYDLDIRIGKEKRRMRIGLRQIDLLFEPDTVGNSFAFRVNGYRVFMRGANWIPADALPARATPEVVADLLDSAIEANMNMLRVWGGGTYEPDWFYEMCSERGILIWQDFMFACNLYPAQDKSWLDDVRIEATQQVRRLSKHPCLALWCGDNELVGAIGWFDESKTDRDRYLALYARLNGALEEVVVNEDTGVPWWPSSPCVGPFDFGDSWHNDTSGDMHFWDVWHESKDFEHYRTVKPRFCSEFGFQSFPSPALIETFTEEHDRNVASQVMDVHQRNDGGNSRIVETLARYFRFPDSFDEMCWLSQVSQGLAMKTAIEFWRAAKPRCMGTLYWQLNDTWPVASWSSLEYGGGWKLVHHMARRFFAPVLVTAQPDGDTIVLIAVNDTPRPVSLNIAATKVDVSGPMEAAGEWACVCPPERAVEVGRLPAEVLAAQEVLHIRWCDVERAHSGENEFWPKRPKQYALNTPSITSKATETQLTLETDTPAFFVTHDFGGAEIWSDNCFTLLPGAPKLLKKQRARGGREGSNTLHWLRG